MRKTILLTMLCLLALESTAQKVTNARFVQEGKQVKIYYVLTEEADVSIYLSTDGGKTYETSPLGHLTGHAGKAVQAGTDRCAVWDVLSDREKLQGSDVRFKIVAARRGGNQNFTVGGVTFTMVHVQGGTFTMGCTSEQGGDCILYEGPAHSVTVSDYYIGETEVTQALWRAVMGSNPSSRQGDTRPVEGAKNPWLWQLREEHRAAVMDGMERRYGEGVSEDFAKRLMEVARRASDEVYADHFADIAYDTYGSRLEQQSDKLVRARFRRGNPSFSRFRRFPPFTPFQTDIFMLKS